MSVDSSDTKAQTAFQSLTTLLGSVPLSLTSSESPSIFLLHNPNIAKEISTRLHQPNSGSGDNDLCRWLYDTFQSSEPDLQLVVLRFLPTLGGLYLSRANLRKSLAGFEAILLAIYAHETISRNGQPVMVNIPDLSHASVYHEVQSSSTETELNLAFLSPTLEPYSTIRSTKRARIVGVSLELYYSKIALMPVSSKIEFCEFCVVWAGQDGDMFRDQVEEKEEKNAGGSGEEEGGKKGRIPLPWELLQPVLRILSHCLLGTNKSKELKDVATAACRSLYARALHDVNSQAILATGSLLKLVKMEMNSTDEPDPTEISDFMNPVISL